MAIEEYFTAQSPAPWRPESSGVSLSGWRCLEAEESGDYEAALKHDQEFIAELLRLTQ